LLRPLQPAAAKLGLANSVISARVAELEGRLGVRLLHRTTRRLSLTTEGARLYERCARLLGAAADAIEVAGGVGVNPEGLLRVTVPVGFGLHTLARVIPDFLRQYPAIRLDLSLSDRQVDIVAEGFDVAVRFASHLRDSTLVARRIGVDRWVLCASPAYLRRRGLPRSVEALAEHDCLQLSTVGARAFTAARVPALSGSLIADNVGGAAQRPGGRGRHRGAAPARVRVFLDFLSERMAVEDWMRPGRQRAARRKRRR
jgi:DNA-binding transcriptional LysR family regulator